MSRTKLLPVEALMEDWSRVALPALMPCMPEIAISESKATTTAAKIFLFFSSVTSNHHNHFFLLFP
jgi:hypothetical protein